jgi:hypothetical protein
MHADCAAGIVPAASSLYHSLAAAGSDAAGTHGSRGLAVATLVSWLVTESLGAYMLRSWFASGGMRRRHGRTSGGQGVAPRDGAGGVSLPVMLGHAGLAFTGFVCWVTFVATAAVPAAWLAIGFLGPGIGFGISTVTVWTPFPADRPDAAEWSDAGPADPPPQNPSPSEKMLHATLADEALTSMLVDDMLARLLAPAEPQPRGRLNFRPLIPAAHGFLAVATFLLATLAAITAL